MRKSIPLMKDWIFIGPDRREKRVDLPHTWNSRDGQDGGDDYWRGTCLYRRHFQVPDFDRKQKEIWICFEGVNASAAVRLNGHTIARHDGGYSTFRANLTPWLERSNELEVAVDNGKNDRVYPQKADFTFYGGIYRAVTLLVVNRSHFTLDDYGSPGLAVAAKPLEDQGRVTVRTWTNTFGKVRVRLLDREGREAAVSDWKEVVPLTDAAGKGRQKRYAGKVSLVIPSVHLWDGLKDPYLYTAEAELYKGETCTDRIRTRFGVRSFRVDPRKGFILNGRPYPLRGVCRHQDRKGVGNALTRQMHDEDMALIREVGANTIRLAHYQHDQYFYDLCDEAGMVVWAEIPYISEHMPAGRKNTVSQMKELICQNFNHPSIVCWGISNEITISTKDRKDMLDNHRLLNDLCHRMDPTRFTTLACYAMCGPFNKSAHITDVVSWNLYLGWYVPGLFLNDLWLALFHLRYPSRAIGYSEYGAEAMTNLHSAKPRRNDHSEEYQAFYHEYMLRCFDRRPYIWATHCWNMFDFAADARDQGGEPGMNHKGLVTFDRKIKKDSFYLYKAWWSTEPFVHLAGKRHRDRLGPLTTIRVYSNQPRVALYREDELVEIQEGEKVFSFVVPIADEEIIHFRAAAGDVSDEMTIRNVLTANLSYRLEKKDKRQKSNWV